MKTHIALLTLLLLAGRAPGGWRIVVTPAGSMIASRARHVAVTLDDGRVLAAGGLAIEVLPLPRAGVTDSAEIFDPAANGWTPLESSMSNPRWDAGAAALPDGRALIAGGMTTFTRQKTGRATRTTEYFSWRTEQFEDGPEMSMPRMEFAPAVLGDGRIALASGRSAEVYDVAAGGFTDSVALRATRFAHGVVPRADDQLLLIGGKGPAGSTVERADFSADRSIGLAVTLRPSVNDAAVAVSDDGYVYLLGAQRADTGETVRLCRRLCVTGDDAWCDPLEAQFPHELGGSDSRVAQFGPIALVAGGEAEHSGHDTLIDKAWLFDLRSERFVAEAPMRVAHDDHGLAVLAPDAFGNDRALVVGGLSDDSGSERPSSSCEILTLAPTADAGDPRALTRSGVGAVWR